MNIDIIRYRVYADDVVVHEDDFDTLDNLQVGYMDDYQEFYVDYRVVAFIEENCK